MLIYKKVSFFRNRLSFLNYFINNKISLSWLLLKFLPVLPPDLRPLLKLSDKILVSSDFNTLYISVITLNSLLFRLISLKMNNEFLVTKFRYLQDSLDRLFDKSRFSFYSINLCLKSYFASHLLVLFLLVSYHLKKLLKSLVSFMKGKEGFIRQILLGKRVDFSARCVIVVEPKLNINQCVIPRLITVVY